MNKSLLLVREVLGKIAPYLFGAIFPLHLVLIFIDSINDPVVITKNISYILMISFMALWGVYFIFNSIYLFKMQRPKNNLEDKGKQPFKTWLKQNIFIIKAVLSCICAILCFCPLICLVGKFYFFHIYFIIWLGMLAISLYYLLSIITTKNRTSLISTSILVGIGLVLVILSAIPIFDMYFGFGANKTLANIFIIIWTVSIIVPQLSDIADGNVKKCKRSANMFLGTIAAIVGFFVLIVGVITVAKAEEQMGRATIAGIITILQGVYRILLYLVCGVSSLSVINFALYTKKYITTKNYLGFFDLALSVVGIILSFIGIDRIVMFMSAI